MQPLAIIAGVLLVVAAAAAIMWAFEEATVVPVGLAVILAAAGCLSFYWGVHGEHAKFHAKHLAIVRDLRAQGFKVPYDAVFAVGGNFLTGTEVDLVEGSCQWEFQTSRLGGRWRVTLPKAKGGGVTVLTPADVEGLAAAC